MTVGETEWDLDVRELVFVVLVYRNGSGWVSLEAHTDNQSRPANIGKSPQSKCHEVYTGTLGGFLELNRISYRRTFV